MALAPALLLPELSDNALNGREASRQLFMGDEFSSVGVRIEDLGPTPLASLCCEDHSGRSGPPPGSAGLLGGSVKERPTGYGFGVSPSGMYTTCPLVKR